MEKLDACNGREETRFSGLPRNSLAENRRGRECYTLSSHEREVRVEEYASDKDREAGGWNLSDRGYKRGGSVKREVVKLEATGEIDFRDIAGSFDVGAVSLVYPFRVLEKCARARQL